MDGGARLSAVPAGPDDHDRHHSLGLAHRIPQVPARSGLSAPRSWHDPGARGHPQALRIILTARPPAGAAETAPAFPDPHGHLGSGHRIVEVLTAPGPPRPHLEPSMGAPIVADRGRGPARFAPGDREEGLEPWC